MSLSVTTRSARVAATATARVEDATAVGALAAAARRSRSQSNSSPAVVRLYKDVLQAIFTFLPFKEFARTLKVSHSWYTAGLTMKPRKDVLVNYIGSIFGLVNSPIKIHIHQLGLAKVEKKELLLVSEGVGHLNHLQLSIHLNKKTVTQFGSSQFIQFPLQLESLAIRFSFAKWGEYDEVKNHARKYINECIKQIVAQSTRLLKLEIELGGFELHNHGLDFPYQLQSLATLTDLTLPFQFHLDQQINLIKSMPNIRQWKRFWNCWLATSVVQRLADGPSPPQLEDIGHLDTVDEAMSEQLQRLPTLTKFEITMALLDPRPFFSSFPRLSILDLNCLNKRVDINYLSMALSSCVTLAELAVSHAELTSEHLSLFLPHLISLVHLRLAGCPSVASFQFLTASRASLNNLRSFEISSSTPIPVMEYGHLNAISSSLEHLMIWGSCNDQLDDLRRARWIVTSPHFRRHEWPRLRSFVHKNTNGSHP